MMLTHTGSDRPAADLSRRNFLRASAVASGGLLLSLSLPFASRESEAACSASFEPNAFIRIGGDGQIVLTLPYVEMGQGTRSKGEPKYEIWKRDKGSCDHCAHHYYGR